MRPTAQTLVAAATLACAAAATVTVGHAQVYKWKDANGVTHYGEKPPRGRSSSTMDIDRRGAPDPGDARPADGCATIRCQYDRLRSDRAVDEAAQRAERDAAARRVARNPQARGMSFDVFSRIDRGMSEGELMLRAGPPDHEATDVYRSAKTWYYYPTASDPFTTAISIRSGQVFELDRVRKF